MHLGPATKLPIDWLTPRVLIVAGEDAIELRACLHHLGTPREHVSRSYRFWRYPDLLVVSIGVGAPNLEPVLYEILAPGVVTHIVLGGTCGAMPNCHATPKTPFVLEPAQAAWMGLDIHSQAELHPNWDTLLPSYPSLGTDLFYGFSPLAMTSYPADAALQAAWDHRKDADALVEMEAPAFYLFCQRFDPKVQFVAIKAIGNPVDDLQALAEGSMAALQASITACLDVLQTAG